MFGLLIKLLRARGYEVDIKGISQESLEHAGTLVLINSNRMFTEPEKHTIWQFVKRGGSLFVVGEHTGLDFIRNPFNDLLSAVNIRFNFDSAVSMVPKWTYGFELAPHYITRNIGDENDLQIWIGASLSVTYPARPVIVGKYAYYDHGDMQAKNR